jgi:hypothetical protein
MVIDRATNLPINLCVKCGCEVLGYVDNPKEDFICNNCKGVDEE